VNFTGIALRRFAGARRGGARRSPLSPPSFLTRLLATLPGDEQKITPLGLPDGGAVASFPPLFFSSSLALTDQPSRVRRLEAEQVSDGSALSFLSFFFPFHSPPEHAAAESCRPYHLPGLIPAPREGELLSFFTLLLFDDSPTR